MSLLDDWLARLRGKASEEAGKAAVGAATSSAKKAVSGFAEGFLSFAEGELADARSSRGLEEGEELEPLVPGTADDAAPPPSAREQREAREAKARDELARLKAMMAEAAPSEGADEP